MKARIYVTLKREVLDPQGDAVRRALLAQGLSGVKDVRIGKLVEVELDGEGGASREALAAMCEKLLANTVVEDYAVELLGGGRP